MVVPILYYIHKGTVSFYFQFQVHGTFIVHPGIDVHFDLLAQCGDHLT